MVLLFLAASCVACPAANRVEALTRRIGPIIRESERLIQSRAVGTEELRLLGVEPEDPWGAVLVNRESSIEYLRTQTGALGEVLAELQRLMTGAGTEATDAAFVTMNLVRGLRHYGLETAPFDECAYLTGATHTGAYTLSRSVRRAYRRSIFSAEYFAALTDEQLAESIVWGVENTALHCSLGLDADGPVLAYLRTCRWK